ncbi:very short patch repair endonuclease [Nitrospirillum sp. BR 11752]|uniref:very short patch repair endonuclease n=1 Tax=Nitrospirillum sp. BR 11752 TaxID=3104293 RepID=UPI002EB4B437|nr:very short patch repair endonuclease [Nitrospirillum sp. BR 11752]
MPTKRKSKAKRPPLTRSQVMSRVRGKDTKPEMAVRRALWAAGYRYRLHAKDLPGRPDIVFRSRKIAIFVHGCFWHGHEGCPGHRIPKSRSEWWAAKIARNKARDAEVRGELEGMGWTVMVVWECEATKSFRCEAILLRVPLTELHHKVAFPNMPLLQS